MKARNRIKPLLTLCCALLLVAAGVFGTLAYLTGTDTVNNTFTVGNVKITLDEAKVTTGGTPVEGADRVKANEYHLLPGHTYTKDPTVTVEEGSDLSYVRMKVTFNNASKLMAMLPSADNLDYDTDAEVELVRKLSPILFLTNYTSTGYNVWAPEFNMDEAAGFLADTKYYVYDAANDTATFIFYYPAMVKAKDVAAGDLALEPIFTEISLPEHVTGEQLAELNNFQITVVAEAIQAGSFANADKAWEAFATQP